jgi:hypothetical protein
VGTAATLEQELTEETFMVNVYEVAREWTVTVRAATYSRARDVALAQVRDRKVPANDKPSRLLVAEVSART